KEYGKAQSLLDQAYGLARARANYHTNHIDTQQARLWLLQAIEAGDVAQSSKRFEEAHRLLKKVPNDLHKFWQLQRYVEYFETQYQRLPKHAQVAFEHAARSMVDDVKRAESAGDLRATSLASVASIRES